jgi:hypothetical protein
MGSELIMSLGAHTGGELYQYPRDVLDIKGRLVECKGLLPHMTLPFEGERYSVVYFQLNPKKKQPPPPEHQQLLEECGF